MGGGCGGGGGGGFDSHPQPFFGCHILIWLASGGEQLEQNGCGHMDMGCRPGDGRNYLWFSILDGDTNAL